MQSSHSGWRAIIFWIFTALGGLSISGTAFSVAEDNGLLFRLSADTSLRADYAQGEAEPNFLSHVSIVSNGKVKGAAQWEDDGVVTWNAASNMYARRGTVAFYWRSRTPVGEAPFNIFRVAFADHTSWDMTFLRIDWNGHGFDAFVTDTNLARVRVSSTIKEPPAPDQWLLLTFTWDETEGVRLYVDGRELAHRLQKADLDSGLDQFGFAGRIVSPHQVQSRYHFMRGSDFDELNIYDHALSASDVAELAAGQPLKLQTGYAHIGQYKAWLHRYGWDRPASVLLEAPSTIIRKVEFSAAYDLKEEMRKGIDGIAETTWPGVYNRSTLPGRDDYFELPDWNVYVRGGKQYDLIIPPDEKFNRVEIRGAAFGTLNYAANVTSATQDKFERLDVRSPGVVRSVSNVAERSGGMLRFINSVQETPIQEIWAYDVHPGTEPQGTFKLSYKIKADAAPEFPCIQSLVNFIDGRYPPEERSIAVALPTSARVAVAAGSPTDTSIIKRKKNMAPLVHVLIPSAFDDSLPARPLSRAWNYGWQNTHDGLDGIAIDIPALHLQADVNGVIPLNIRVKDPLWPERDMMDVSVAVRPDEPRTIWLDLRDRILSDQSFYIAIASANPEFGAETIDGMTIRLVFKDREVAKAEHVADRFNQVKDNWGYLVEEHTSTRREALYRRVLTDITDLLAVDPDNVQARIYWQDISYYNQSMPAMGLAKPATNVPAWAFTQLEDLKLTQQFVNWWIDHRQDEYGDFGGGISDDTDLTQQWPGLALMGVDSDKINHSLRALSDAVYRNGMIVNGLSYITTDELHVYEEGLNSDAERLYLNWGEPKTLERMMKTVNALQNVIHINPAGHMHFASNWYGGRKIYREGPWQWQKPYSFTVLHTPILLGVYNADSTARKLVTGVIDGLLAHAKQGSTGNWQVPNEINWQTDAERAGDGGGVTTPLQGAWAAYRFTDNADYLRQLFGMLAKHAEVLGEINEDGLDALKLRPKLGEVFVEKALHGTAFDKFVAWQISGDKKWLNEVHEKEISEKTQRLYMYTEGHRWTDRVESPTEILQRERLGGVALARNYTYPGHVVSWKFDQPDAGTKVAILVEDVARDHFKVVAYNTTSVSQRVEMTTWNVISGLWMMRRGQGVDGDQLSADVDGHEVELGRSLSIMVEFPPNGTTILEFKLDKADEIQPEHRSDLGIGIDDVRISGNKVTVAVHSLGSRATNKAIAILHDRSGHIYAKALIPALAAPVDLKPRLTIITLVLPSHVRREDISVNVRQLDGAREVTLMNNSVNLADVLKQSSMTP